METPDTKLAPISATEILVDCSLIMSHAACVGAGAYKGFMNGRGIQTDIPFRYLLGANAATTAATVLMMENQSIKRESSTNLKKCGLYLTTILQGAAVGSFYAPLEFMAGYVMGYIPGKVFY